MKFHQIHVGQTFIPKAIRFQTTYTKTGHSTAKWKNHEYHFAATDEVDGTQPTNKHPQPSWYPVRQSGALGGMLIVGNAIEHLSQDASRNFHESPYKRDLYQRSTEHAVRYLRESFDTLKKEYERANHNVT